MDAGKLDRRVQFLRATLADDGFSNVEEFAPHGMRVWAARQDISDGEKMRGGLVSASIMARFTIRSSNYSRDLTPRDRIDQGGLVWEIIGIKEIGRNQFLEVTAQARSDG